MGFLPISLNGATSGAALLFPLACRPHQPPWLAPLHSAETRKGLYVAAQCQDLSHACDSGGGSERSAFACEKCNTLLGRWCEPSLDMGEATADQESNRHQKTHPVSLGFASAASDVEESAQKTQPPPRPQFIAQKSRRKERRGKVCFLFLFPHSPVIAKEANEHAPCLLRVFCVCWIRRPWLSWPDMNISACHSLPSAASPAQRLNLQGQKHKLRMLRHQACLVAHARRRP
jgi:hypothetical protein